ncbi:unnamed protein product, partial [Coregonus sp. 'balchen']
MRTPVSVLRLPRGPDPNSRGFDPNSPRFIALCPTTISSSTETGTDYVQIGEQQRAWLRRSLELRTLTCSTSKFRNYIPPLGCRKKLCSVFQFNVPPLEGDVSTVFATGMSGGSYTTRFSDAQQFSAVQAISLGRHKETCLQ